MDVFVFQDALAASAPELACEVHQAGQDADAHEQANGPERDTERPLEPGGGLGGALGEDERAWHVFSGTGERGDIMHQVLGEAAEELIEPIHAAALSYPYAREYTMWPGPNSNSFTAWIGLEVPQLALQLPAKAIGEGWMHANYRN